jgi:L-threonylcarbamoyladenylate synthase
VSKTNKQNKRESLLKLKCDNAFMSIISNCTASAIKSAASVLASGDLVVFPTETVYGLGADATNKDGISRIYEVKGRPSDHPLIVHISSHTKLDKWAREVPGYAITLARTFWPGPLTLVLPRTKLAQDFITGDQDNVALRVPSHPIAQALLIEFENEGGMGIAAPSANRFGKVSPTTASAVESELGSFLNNSDQILDGGPSTVGVESTIIDCTKDIPMILRPGAVSIEMIENLLSRKLQSLNTASNQIRVPGSLQSHYSPNAKVFLSGTPKAGDGLIAHLKIKTPDGVIRLASPVNNDEYAHLLYNALRQADTLGLSNVYAVPPNNDGVGFAINDRLKKAAR